jgi:hypothetical protein
MGEAAAAETVQRFREILNDFKVPYLLKLEEEPLLSDTDIQDMDQVNQMLREFDVLYRILRTKIQDPNRAEGGDMATKAVLSVFERAGIFNALRKAGSPSLKEDLLYALDLDLKTYPFTRSARHIGVLEHNNVESFQRKIVPNLE